ncbi:MAG: CPBP family intramembrane metalloprotease, partial [Spirochaetes bacterium]|nr:CPBP family intramembrane metalloprotease [Spirochaetota bacterium]
LFFFNIMGEELFWRGYIFPRQELAFKEKTWIIQGLLWTMFHIPFGWKLLVTVIPMIFIITYIVQKRKNTWVSIALHAIINGPAFIMISLGVIG